MVEFPNFLRVAIVPKIGIFDVKKENRSIVTKNGSVVIEGGSENEILELLSSALNFKYQVLAPADEDWGNYLGNNTWSGTIGMVYRGEADLAIGKIAITESRALALDYSYPYDIERLTFGTKIPGLVPKYASFIWPFSWGLWIGIFLILIFMSVMLHILLCKNYSLQTLGVKIFGNLLHQQLNIEYRKCSDKILITGWLLGSMFISYSYNAVLLSFLTIPQRNKGIRYLDELAEAVGKGSYRCMVFSGDSHAEIFRRSPQPSVQRMGNLILENNWKIRALSSAAKEVMADGRTAVVAPKFFFQNILANQALISHDSLSAITRALFFRKDFCCKELMDKYIHRIAAGGFYPRYLNLQLYQRQFSTASAASSNTDSSFKSLKIKDMLSAFLLLFLGYFLAFFALIVEKCHFKKINTKK
ncbi:glutamate receptor ionotropic, kainate 4-like [Argiope bruennichi]|uniref:Glutamate receptor ionotropic like protein n=1 Tax=Argiope bruennichi TaxID=94029 RepID=A0A8T0FWS1_ARGBR|nr:glutamate receptor ionotropic, kainate 4-like [Argiope bruennichi]KAF8794638.1 Glutamate receptor ionotropic like protein [Argiope bruennichi]